MTPEKKKKKKFATGQERANLSRWVNFSSSSVFTLVTHRLLQTKGWLPTCGKNYLTF